MQEGQQEPGVHDLDVAVPPTPARCDPLLDRGVALWGRRQEVAGQPSAQAGEHQAIHPDEGGVSGRPRAVGDGSWKSRGPASSGRGCSGGCATGGRPGSGPARGTPCPHRLGVERGAEVSSKSRAHTARTVRRRLVVSSTPPRSPRYPVGCAAAHPPVRRRGRLRSVGEPGTRSAGSDCNRHGSSSVVSVGVGSRGVGGTRPIRTSRFVCDLPQLAGGARVETEATPGQRGRPPLPPTRRPLRSAPGAGPQTPRCGGRIRQRTRDPCRRNGTRVQRGHRPDRSGHVDGHSGAVSVRYDAQGECAHRDEDPVQRVGDALLADPEDQSRLTRDPGLDRRAHHRIRVAGGASALSVSGGRLGISLSAPGVFTAMFGVISKKARSCRDCPPKNTRRWPVSTPSARRRTQPPARPRA